MHLQGVPSKRQEASGAVSPEGEGGGTVAGGKAHCSPSLRTIDILPNQGKMTILI